MTGVARKPVGEVDHGVRRGRQALALFDPERGAEMHPDQLGRLLVPELEQAETRGRPAERTGDDENVAGPGPGAARDALAAADCRDAQIDAVTRARVAAAYRNTRLAHALVELECVLRIRLRWAR